MRKPSVTRALGGGVLAFGLVAAGAGIAAAESQSPDIGQEAVQGQAQDQVSAMARDLDLTKAEAEKRMTQEAEARSVDQDLRSELGDAWGGSYFDAESGKLAVAITDKAAADTVRDAGATPDLVTYGEDELDSIVADLNAQGADLSDGVTGWHSSISDDTVVIKALEGQTDAAEQLVSDAGVEADAVEIVETAHKPQTYADVVGGDAYMIDNSGRCSIGFAVEGGFATAGHCGDVGTPVSSEDGSGTGEVANSEFPGSDMGHVETDDNWTPTPEVNDYAGGTVTVAGHDEAPEGSSVCRSGSTTGWECGEIVAHGETVQYPQGTVEGLTETTACAEPGDSGGSWLAEDQAQGVTSGGSGNCSIGGTTFYQPLNPILDAYNLTLLTG